MVKKTTYIPRETLYCDFCGRESSSHNSVLKCQVCQLDICSNCGTEVPITKGISLYVCADCARLDYLDYAEVVTEASKLNELAEVKFREAYAMLQEMARDSVRKRNR